MLLNITYRIKHIKTRAETTQFVFSRTCLHFVVYRTGKPKEVESKQWVWNSVRFTDMQAVKFRATCPCMRYDETSKGSELRWDSSVTEATGYWVDGRGLIPVKGFLFPHYVQAGLGQTYLALIWHPEGGFPTKKVTGGFTSN